MWVKREDYERLVKQAAQSELMQDARDKAEARAKSAEADLRVERESKDFMTLQMASRVVTKHGGYGLNETPVKVEQNPHPKGFIREEEPTDTARFQYYVTCYQNAGKPLDEAQALATQLYEAEMRGESVTYDYERDEELIG
jgi:hypothetical protein